MYRGTTPTLVLNIDGIELENLKTILVLIKNGNTLIEKNNEGFLIEDNSIKLTLTQEETLLLNSSERVYVQVRILTQDDKAVATNISNISVKDILNNEVLE